MKIKTFSRVLLQRNLGDRRWNYFVQKYDYKKTVKQNRELSNYLQRNIKYKNIHQGERCFILGNGPSLKQHNLSLLENEIVFTCNQIARNPEFRKIKTNYHFWADPIFFNLDENLPEDMELIDTMKSVVADDNNPECFYSSDGYSFVKKHSLEKDLNLNFYTPRLKLCDNFNMDLDFSKFVPYFHTVVQYSIALAIYMGFKEIYIIGSEFTGIKTSINLRLQNSLEDDYAYEITENEKKRMTNRTNKISFEQELNSFHNVVRDYRILNEYCLKRNIKLINCTPGGLIESLPREKFENILSAEVNKV